MADPSFANGYGNSDFQPVQKRPLSAMAAPAPSLTPSKMPKTDGFSLFSNNAPGSFSSQGNTTTPTPNSLAPTKSIVPANSIASTSTAVPATAVVSSNAAVPPKLFSTSAQAPPKPPFPADGATENPTENANGTTEIVSTEDETSQREKTEEDIRAYCEAIDMFDQIVKKLWRRGKKRKNATPNTENQLLLASVEKDLMKKMAARLYQLADAL
ncbi:hypothetical protein TCE0_043r15757 [Talaromyces pinophilus]|uniref:Uncharacterized protein n=1 Tax=Talaromyces pinophilus TaxID=128442 RepID=A0A0B8MYS2_TALPI|nr:hypothetical protein TCE0_043r15757 [Talaromyces pinophilus]